MDAIFGSKWVCLFQPTHGRMLLDQVKTRCLQVCADELQVASEVERVDAFTFRFLNSENGLRRQVSFDAPGELELLVREPFRFAFPNGISEAVSVEFPDGMLRDTGVIWDHFFQSPQQALERANQQREAEEWQPSTLLSDEMCRFAIRLNTAHVMRLNNVGEDDAVTAGYEGRMDLIDSWNRTHEPDCTRAENNPWVWVVEIDSVRSTWNGLD